MQAPRPRCSPGRWDAGSLQLEQVRGLDGVHEGYHARETVPAALHRKRDTRVDIDIDRSKVWIPTPPRRSALRLGDACEHLPKNARRQLPPRHMLRHMP